MLYCEWLMCMHPVTREHYTSTIYRRYSVEPTYIVFIDQIEKRGRAGAELFDWLEANSKDEWFDVGRADVERYHVLGFNDEHIAAAFKLTFGNGYDPRLSSAFYNNQNIL